MFLNLRIINIYYNEFINNINYKVYILINNNYRNSYDIVNSIIKNNMII